MSDQSSPNETDTQTPTDATAQANAVEETDGHPSEPALEALQADLAKFRDLALRSQADLDNYRKRAAREKEEALRYANASLLERLLPVIDSFDLGLAAARADSAESPVFQGMSLVRKQLGDFLADSGLVAVEAEGQAFDPNRHEAIGQEPHDSIPEGHVIRQLRSGYILHGRLLRPAMVFLSKGPAGE